jgi:aminoglycoside phosphotransferase (APT) family kinase protein
MIQSAESALPEQLLKWIIDAVDPQAVIKSVRPMSGSTSSTLHSVALEVNKVIEEYVVRQFDNYEWLQLEPDLALHEAKSLGWATKTGLPTPQIIAFDETGVRCGLPTVLMTKLEGAIVLMPPDMEQWLAGLAEALVSIHTVKADKFPWKYFTYTKLASLEIPAWSSFPELWASAIKILNGPPPTSKPTFIHRDYHPVNVLWHQGKVSGIVDWVNACEGPAGIDLGHCRVNLAQLYDVPTADRFLSLYQTRAGADFSYDPYWDILSLADILSGPPQVYPGWTAFGITGLTAKLMIKRLDQYLISLLERWSRQKLL